MTAHLDVPTKRPTSRTVAYSDEALERDLERLRDLWEDFQSNRDRDAVYAYLAAVFDLVQWWMAEGKAEGRARRALWRQHGKGEMLLEPFSVIIYCTSNGKRADKKARSRWARTLRFAAAYKYGNETLQHFIKRKGGINRCTARYARRLGRLAKIH